MEHYAIILWLLALSVAVSSMADKIKIPYPILLIVTGILVGCIPWFEYLSINPEIIFLIFIPPLLFDASVKIDYKHFIKNFPTISFMGVTLVLFSMVGIAVVAYYLIPSMTRPLAFLLWAILSPPDAVISSGITKEDDLSHRSRAILEWESLINDATALTAFRFILTFIAGGNLVFWKVGLQGFGIILGGCAVWVLLFFLFKLVIKKFSLGAKATTSLLLLLPFVSYLVAESIHLSGELAVVLFGLLTVGFIYRKKLVSDRVQQQTTTIFSMIVYLLNGLIFILIGLELPYVVSIIDASNIWLLVGVSVVIVIVALVIRMFFLFRHKRKLDQLYLMRKGMEAEQKTLQKEIKTEPSSALAVKRWEVRARSAPERLSRKDTFLLWWSSMRGIVSLAMALSIPLMLGNETFPMRDTLIFITVCVIVIMLVIQGFGLPWLVKKLNGNENEVE